MGMIITLQSTLLPVAGLVLVKAADDAGPKDKKGNQIVRPYTPVSAPETPGEVSFLIKKYDTGKVAVRTMTS
jgi:cytochrome-b5 reductase